MKRCSNSPDESYEYNLLQAGSITVETSALLPLVGAEKVFALKGGTAIIFFIELS